MKSRHCTEETHSLHYSRRDINRKLFPSNTQSYFLISSTYPSVQTPDLTMIQDAGRISVLAFQVALLLSKIYTEHPDRI